MLDAFCRKYSISLTALSQISFVSVDFKIQNPFDVVFFASPRSAEFFLTRQSLPLHTKCACVGKGTATFLEKNGFSVDFTGTKPGNPLRNARDFALWLGPRRVLFPHSNLALGNMRQFISPEQLECVQVYTTEFQSEVIQPHDLYIFTSPSNVEGFLVKNPPPIGEIIAWGESTRNALLANDIAVSHTLLSSHENEVIDYIES
jgi:uroporphyrinogen-III synthase